MNYGREKTMLSDNIYNIREVLNRGFDSVSDDEPIRALEENTLESLQTACKTNKENNFNSLDILVPIAKQMLNSMHSDDLLEFIENRYETLRLRLDNNYFNQEAE